LLAAAAAPAATPRTRTRRWINRAKRTTAAAAPLPRGAIPPRTLRTHRRPSMKRPGDPPVTALIHPSSPPEATPGWHDPFACRERGYDTHGRGTRNVLSYRHATRPIRAIPNPLRPMLLVNRAIRALAARRPFASHPTMDAAAYKGSGRRLTNVCAGQPGYGAPRRNRTGDPILTMDRWPSAVLRRIFAARATPSMPQLWAQSPWPGNVPGSCVEAGMELTHRHASRDGREATRALAASWRRRRSRR
jgi:hypothetical protein